MLDERVRAVLARLEAEDADEAAPRPLADERAHLVLVEHPRQQVAAGAGGLVDDHRLRPLDRGEGRLEIGAVAHRPVGDEWPPQDVDVVVGYLAAAVPEHLGGGGLNLAELVASQRRLARYAPATALAMSYG